MNLTNEELFRKEEHIPNLATDLAEAGLIILDIERTMTPAAQEIDKLELVRILSKAKARYYLKVAKGEIDDPMSNRKIAILRSIAYLKRAGCSLKEIGTTMLEIWKISSKHCNCGTEMVLICKKTDDCEEIWEGCPLCGKESRVICVTCQNELTLYNGVCSICSG